MPIRSRAQWRYLFATGKPFARRWAHETPGGKGTRYRILPAKKKAQQTFGGTKRADLDEDVFAGPERSFPIKTAQDVRDAVQSLGRTKHDKATVKRGIIRRARAIGATDALPESWRQTTKATGYSARVGQVIRGNLARGQGGRFSSAGNAGDAAPQAAAPEKPTRRRAPLTRRRGETDEQLAAREADRERRTTETQAARETERRQTRQANRERIYSEQGLAEDAQSAITALYEGGDNTDDGGLVEMGLAEQNRDGTYRLTPQGRQYVRAAERGDIGAARDVLAAARDRLAQRGERQATQEAKRQEREAAKKKREAARATRRGARERLRQSARKRTPKRETVAQEQEREPARPNRPARRPAKRRPITLRPRPKPAVPALTPDQLAALGLPVFGPGGSTTRKALAVFKDREGSDRWLTITTTAYKDRDGEWISREALRRAVEMGDRTGQRGVLRFWHVPGLDFGTCDYQATAQDGRFLIESGTCTSPRHAAVVKAAAHAGWQVSPGFLHPLGEPNDRIYRHMALFERSFVPPGRVSNPLTRLYSQEGLMLTEEKKKALADLVGDSALLDVLLSQIEATDKAAQEQGAVYKDAPDWAQALISRLDALETTVKQFGGAPAEDAIAETDAPAEEMMAEEGADDGMDETDIIQAIVAAVVEALGPLFGELKGAMNFEKKMADAMGEMKALYGGAMAQKDAAIAEVKETVTQVDTRLKTLEGDQPAGAQGYRASQDPKTILTLDAETLKAIAPGAPNDPFADIREFMVGAQAQ